MKLLIAYGSLGKYFHLKEFADELERQNVEVKLVHDIEYSKGFPSKKISDWFNGDKRFFLWVSFSNYFFLFFEIPLCFYSFVQ